MSMKKTVKFLVAIESDGVATTIAIDLTKDPVFLVPVGAGTFLGIAPSQLLSLTGIVLTTLACDLGVNLGGTSYNTVTKVLTVQFNTPGAAGAINVLLGTAEYP